MTVNVLDFGAIGDEKTLNTDAIQKAIDKCNQSGGGKVVIPCGTYIIGTIRLKSNVQLHLEMGAVLKASENLDHYNNEDEYPENGGSVAERWQGKHLILCVRQENVAITGLGTVDGNAFAFYEEHKEPKGVDKYCWMFGQSRTKVENYRPGQMICFIDTKQITLKDFNVVNSHCWSVFLHGCKNARISGLNISNQIYHENTDGIDIDTCENVTVSNCIIKTGDDCITFRCNAARLTNGMDTCKNVTVTNCVLSCAVCAFRVGVGVGKIRNIAVSNISIERCGSVVKAMTSYCGHGEAHIENLTFDNIVAEKASMSLVFDAPISGSIKNVSVSNLKAYTCASLKAVAKEPAEISGLKLSNIELISENADYPLAQNERNWRGNSVIYCENAKDVSLRNINVIIKEDFEGKWASIYDEKNSTVTKQNCNF